MTLVAGSAIPAQAAEPAVQTAAVSAAPHVLTAAAAAVGQWGSDLTFEQAVPQARDAYTHYRVTAQPDGSAVISTVDGGRCLRSAVLNGPKILTDVCTDALSRRFTFIPVTTAPTAVADTPRSDQFFYIVSVATGQCISSDKNGLNFPNEAVFSLPVLATCSPGDGKQQFRVHDEQPNPDGIYNEWRNILELAISAASQQCDSDHTTCSVSPDSTPGSWYRPDDNSLADKGSLSLQNYGCGNPASINGVNVEPTYVNNTPDNQTVTVGGTVSVSNTKQSTTTFGTSTTFESTGGVKDVWGIKFTQTFSYQNQQVVGTTTGQTATATKSSIVRPNDSLMTVWSGRVYSIAGQWRFGEKVAVKDPASQSLQWTIPVSSTFPVALAGEAGASVRTVASREPKSCFAVDGSTIDSSSTVKITTKTGNCLHPPRAPSTIAVGAVVKACPGIWNVPAGKGSSETNFRYQWYVYASDGDPGTDIPGATSSRYAVQDSTFNPAKPFLGVRVWDAGNADRLESPTKEVAPIGVRISKPVAAERSAAVDAAEPIADPSVLATNFVGDVDDATTGMPYEARLVTDAGSGIDLSVSGLPQGISMSADGVLSGEATTPGSYAVTVVDTPSDGGPEQDQSIQLDVYDPPATFDADREITTTVGQAFSERLVAQIPPGMGLTVTGGVLPNGVDLDGTDGELAGSPDSPGTYPFALDDAESPQTHGAFSLVVDRRSPQFAPGLAQARVGVAYEAQTVEAPGTGSLFALAADSEELPAGLTLDGNTGAITGTPTEATSRSVRLIDVANRDSTFSSTLIISTDGSSTPVPDSSAKPRALAATGANGVQSGLLALLAVSAAAGGGFALIHSRRRARVSELGRRK